MDLVAQRAAIVADHKGMEKVPQSPWHPKHPIMREAMDKGETLLSNRPIAFLCDDEVVVVGECIKKIYDGLKKFVEREAKGWDDPAKCAAKLHDYNCVKRCRKFVEQPAPKEIRVPQGTWNSYLHGLNEVGVQVVLTEGTFEDARDVRLR
jgi:hypothetical protein